MRNSLIEILAKSGASFEYATPEDVADHLLAEGVILLPCKLNSTVYDISEFVDKHPYPDMYEFSTNDILLSQCRTTKELIFGIDGIDYTFDEFGKTVFLTREEAEKALEGRKKTINLCDLKCEEYTNAQYLYAKGYRKTSDVVRDILAEIEELLGRYYLEWRFCYYDGYPIEGFAELKKKYTEGV